MLGHRCIPFFFRWETSNVEAFLTLLAEEPLSNLIRKRAKLGEPSEPPEIELFTDAESQQLRDSYMLYLPSRRTIVVRRTLVPTTLDLPLRFRLHKRRNKCHDADSLVVKELQLKRAMHVYNTGELPMFTKSDDDIDPSICASDSNSDVDVD